LLHLVINIIFTIEIGIKIISYGFILSKNSYFREINNILEFIALGAYYGNIFIFQTNNSLVEVNILYYNI
jgi:hypothetical protein